MCLLDRYSYISTCAAHLHRDAAHVVPQLDHLRVELRDGLDPALVVEDELGYGERRGLAQRQGGAVEVLPHGAVVGVLEGLLGATARCFETSKPERERGTQQPTCNE